MADAAFEDQLRSVATRLHGRCAGRRPSLYRGLTGMLMARVAADPRLARSLFQLVDALPRLTDNRALAEHLAAYLEEAPAGGWPQALLRLGSRPGLAGLVRWQVGRLARRFLVAEEAVAFGRALDHLDRIGCTVTVDAVGEAVLGEAEAAAYLARTRQVLAWLQRRPQQPALSLKLSAFTARFDPLDPAGTRRRVFAALEPLVAAACDCGAALTVDMEQHELKPLILGLFQDALAAFPDPRWQPGIALQAYLPETGDDLASLSAAARRHGRRLTVRLVKGAYWDQEQAWAAQRGWPVPTHASKAATDAAFEAHTAWLLARSDHLYPAIASHNLRSQAVALTHARRLGLARDAWEAQLLQGMAEPLRDALVTEDAAVRIYLPAGDLLPGIAYLMRRLLENAASSSVLRLAYVERTGFDALIAPPIPTMPTPTPAPPAAGFTNLPLLNFSRPGEAEAFAAALAGVRAGLPQPADRHSGPAHPTRNPADPEQRLGETATLTADRVGPLVAAAADAQRDWAERPAGERAAILHRAADAIAGRRRELAALAVLEVAKNWREADADVAEAVDFLRYYADGMQALAGWQTTRHFPGEDNRRAWFPRGVAAVIAPWNFPYALLGGMAAAALAAGNAAVLKPALPALLCAAALHRLLLEAGVPPDLVPLAPGDAAVGEALVTDPGVHVVAFTGSRAVGLEILRRAHTPWPGQRHVKQVICEMGGKNAVIVDTDADLDEAVAGIVASAFGYAGQKCSACARVIAVGTVHERLLARLADAAAALAWGPPEDPAYAHGPLISAAARDKALAYIDIGRREGRLVWQGQVPDRGWYVPPSLFADILPHHRLAREEVFGPVLAVLKAPDFAAALDLANDSDYGLTGGVYSRLPAHLALAEQCFGVGNLYLNRRITGARVGIQPFGGWRLSGTGAQTGGPEYLQQFLAPRTVTRNTMRHGFIPNESAPGDVKPGKGSNGSAP